MNIRKGKLSEFLGELKNLLLKTYKSLTEDTLVIIPTFGSQYDSIFFVVLDESINLESLTDSDIKEYIENKKIAGIGSLYSPAIWTLEPGASCLCDPGYESSLWGSEVLEEETSIKALDPYNLFTKDLIESLREAGRLSWKAVLDAHDRNAPEEELEGLIKAVGGTNFRKYRLNNLLKKG